jgi:Arc/MetJ-type ribon-helix-helix transcriptional regulator
MSLISVRIPDPLLREIDARAEDLHLGRAAYVREALQRMNASVAAQGRRRRLMEVSLRVRGESKKVNADFSEIDDDPGA